VRLRDAADVLGVHYQTAYGWVREGTLPARKSGRGYEVRDRDVEVLAARRAAGRPASPHIRVRDWAVQSAGLYQALAAGDEPLARRRIDRLAAGVPVADLCARVIGPALRRVGDDWAAGTLTIAAEHRASMICERLIAVRSRQPLGRPRGIALVSTPAGERHGLPAVMAAACLRQDRWLVHHLACDLPAVEVTGMARVTGAGLVVLSAATTRGARRGVREAIELTAADPSLRVLTGKPGDSLYDLLRLARAAAGEGAAGPAA
jgi:MerR family transcriptional regulator, light-induced transcriptional regulator